MFKLAFRSAIAGAIALCILSNTGHAELNSNIRIIRINDYLTAFYDGRPATPPPKSDRPRNWIEYGSMDLGIATYAIHRGNHAIVYDTFPTVQKAKWLRNYQAEKGITRFTVVNSHFHWTMSAEMRHTRTIRS